MNSAQSSPRLATSKINATPAHGENPMVRPTGWMREMVCFDDAPWPEAFDGERAGFPRIENGTLAEPLDPTGYGLFAAVVDGEGVFWVVPGTTPGTCPFWAATSAAAAIV